MGDKTNVVLSVWDGTRNVAVISSMSEKFIAELRRLAKEKGYRVEPVEREES